MKFLVFALAVITIAIALAIEDSDWVAGRTEREARSIFETEINRSFCANAPNGAKNCTSRPGCSNAGTFQCFNGYAVNQMSCRETAPYCNSGSCVSVPPAGCDPAFVCPGLGNYPKFDDCYTYYVCYFDQTSNSIKFTTKKCPTNYPFNPSGPNDKLCLFNSTCVKTNCTLGTLAEWRPLNYVDFTKDQIALYCTNGIPHHLDSCLNGQSIDLKNVTSRHCNVKCAKDYQKAVYSANRSKFFICLGGVAYLEDCEVGKDFNEQTMTCETRTIGPTTTTRAGATTTLKP